MEETVSQRTSETGKVATDGIIRSRSSARCRRFLPQAGTGSAALQAPPNAGLPPSAREKQRRHFTATEPTPRHLLFSIAAVLEHQSTGSLPIEEVAPNTSMSDVLVIAIEYFN